MQDIILSPISLESFELLIKKSVTAALALTQPEPQVSTQTEQFTIAQLATYLNCTKATIHAYKKRGVFPFYQTGRTVYFKKSDVDAALSSKQKKGLNRA